MGVKSLEVATIIGDVQVDHAIATLVLAFTTDPVARWMYDDPHQYLLHLPRLFRTRGTRSFEPRAAQRTNEGMGVAIWLPPGAHGDDRPLESGYCGNLCSGEAIRSHRRLRTDGILPANRAPLVLIAHWGRSIASQQWMRCGTAAALPSSMRPRAPPRIPLVFEPAKHHALPEAWL